MVNLALSKGASPFKGAPPLGLYHHSRTVSYHQISNVSVHTAAVLVFRGRTPLHDMLPSVTDYFGCVESLMPHNVPRFVAYARQRYSFVALHG